MSSASRGRTPPTAATPAPPPAAPSALHRLRMMLGVGSTTTDPTVRRPGPWSSGVPGVEDEDDGARAPLATPATSCGLGSSDPLWVASLSSNEDEDEELAPRTPLTAAHGPDSNAVRATGDAGLLPAGDRTVEERSVPVGPGGHGHACPTVEERGGHAHRPTDSARSFAFKWWARGRCYRCLARDHLVRNCREPFRCLGCLRPGHLERDCRRRPVMPDAPSHDLRNSPPGSHHACSWAEIAAQPPVGDDRCALLRHLKVHGVFRHVQESYVTCDACHADVVVCDDTDEAALDQWLQATFATQLALFRSQIQDMVAQVIQPLREEVSSFRLWSESVAGLDPAQVTSVDVGLDGAFGPCSPVHRTSSPSSMVASIAACRALYEDCRAAYEEKGGLPVVLCSETMQNVALPEDGTEVALVEDQS